MPKFQDDDLPTRSELEHLPHANTYFWSDYEIDDIIRNSITARATHLQDPATVQWGRHFRMMAGERPK